MTSPAGDDLVPGDEVEGRCAMYAHRPGARGSDLDCYGTAIRGTFGYWTGYDRALIWTGHGRGHLVERVRPVTA